ncbi:netrin receptor DCC-like isoform X2 [Homarus americanus]|uniref:netrin receptor DCC-like isoform X2 n=1 Tax=Homarus americanus TaxID=6706 RepID=UPI001C43984B|nr:netrin receptor DCC-like isoform X2 [Homarus americanus]
MGGQAARQLLTLLLLMLWTPHTHLITRVATDGVKATEEGWWEEGSAPQPQFENTPSNVTARVGDSAFLPCTVSNLGDRSVTWMRQRDLHILTAGIFTYSADDRFTVLHADDSNEWTLQIKFATIRDSGIYECHVNSDPKISRQVALLVREHSQLDDPAFMGITTTTTHPTPVVLIEGPAERHIQAGSVLTLTCLIHHPPRQAPAHVLWFHGTTNIDYDSPRGGVSIQTEKFPRKTRSQVMLSNVRDSDSGEYSCSPSDLPPTVITVHVQHGQHQAAVQQGGLSAAPVANPVTHLLLLLLLMMLQRVKTWQ